MAGLFFAAFFLRVWWMDASSPLTGDEPDYDFLARQIIAGNGFAGQNGEPTAWRTPGFPFVLAVIYEVFGDDVRTARIVLVFITSSIAPIVTWFCFLIFGDKRAAILAGLFWTFMANSLQLSPMLMGEETATLSFLISLVLARFALTKSSVLLTFLSSAVFAFSVLTRGYLLFVVFAVPIWFVYNRKKHLAVCFLLFSSAVIGTWVLRNYVVMGNFGLSTQAAEVVWFGSSQFARGSAPGTWNSQNCAEDSPLRDYLTGKYPDFCGRSESEISAIFSRENSENLFENVKKGFILAPKKVLIFFNPSSHLGFDAVYLAAFCFSMIGIVFLRFDRTNLVLLAAPVVFALMLNISTFADSRHRHPINVVIVILGAFGAVRLFELVSKKYI